MQSFIYMFSIANQKKLKICVEHFFWHIMKKLQCEEVKKLKNGWLVNEYVTQAQKLWWQKKSLKCMRTKMNYDKNIELFKHPTMKHDN